jgi:hypothetical protein
MNMNERARGYPLHWRNLLSLSVLGAALLAGQNAHAVARFGTECQADYQNNWQTNLSHSWKRCGWFNDELDDTDTKVFYYNLDGAKPYFETTSDQFELDNVHLVYVNTHGGGWSTKSVWAMWNQNVLADSLNMRLGDEAYGLSIFSTYSCETLKFNDSKMWTRMSSIMRGGVRIATGSHDKLYDSITTDEVGEDYADNLQDGDKIKYAWKDANSDWATDQDVTVMATGTNESNCHSRRDNMKWQNFGSYGRIRDNQIGWYCYWYWNNL